MGFLKRRMLSFKYAFQGVKWVFLTQPNIWMHFIAALLAIGLGFYLQISRLDWIIIITCIIMVFAAEFCNTALEWLVDGLYKTQHDDAGKIKDVAAAVVLVIAIGVVIIGTLVFIPYIKTRFF